MRLRSLCARLTSLNVGLNVINGIFLRRRSSLLNGAWLVTVLHAETVGFELLDMSTLRLYEATRMKIHLHFSNSAFHVQPINIRISSLNACSWLRLIEAPALLAWLILSC